MLLFRTLLYAFLLSLMVGCVSTSSNGEGDDNDNDNESELDGNDSDNGTDTGTDTNNGTDTTTNTGTTTTFTLSSTNLTDGTAINMKYTCDGINTNPQLSWVNGPGGANSYTIIMDDPDTVTPANTFVHWNVYDLTSATTSIAEGVTNTVSLPSGAKEGLNDFSAMQYNGPCPPLSSTHTYKFAIYALNIPLTIGTPAAVDPTTDTYTRAEFEAAFTANILDQADISVTYSR